jgi:hypothetical protein
MADQSQFSRFSKKHLIFICERLLDGGFDAVNPYDNYDDSYKALEEVAKYFNTPISDEDVQFFGKLLKDNDDLIADIFANQGENKNNKDLIEQLQIPVAKDYKVEYTVDGTCNFTENYVTTTSSYEKEWVFDSLSQQHDDGNFDLYEGRLESTDYDNWQMNDWNFQEVNDISPSIEESLLGRIVLENTQDALSSLDKKTLIKLKSIIESRLRLL